MRPLLIRALLSPGVHGHALTRYTHSLGPSTSTRPTSRSSRSVAALLARSRSARARRRRRSASRATSASRSHPWSMAMSSTSPRVAGSVRIPTCHTYLSIPHAPSSISSHQSTVLTKVCVFSRRGHQGRVRRLRPEHPLHRAFRRGCKQGRRQRYLRGGVDRVVSPAVGQLGCIVSRSFWSECQSGFTNASACDIDGLSLEGVWLGLTSSASEETESPT